MERKESIYSNYKHTRYIVILFVGAIMFPVWGYFLNALLPEVNDPITFRYALSLAMLSLIIFKRRKYLKFNTWFNNLFLFVIQIANLYIFWVTANSQNHEYYIFGNFLAVTFIGVILNNIRDVLLHSILSVIFFSLFNLHVNLPHTPLIIHALLIVSALLLISVNLYDRFSLESKLLSQYEVNKTQEKELDISRAKNVEIAKLKSFEIMASGIAHEINNPLMIISGNVSKLMRNAHDKMTIASLTKISSTALRISVIIQNLKIISDDATGFKVKSTQMSHIVELTMLIMKSKLERANIQLTIEDFLQDTLFYCCPKSISKIMINLLLNSYASTKGISNPKIRIKSQIIDGHIDIRVTDNGEEIDESIKASIMDPFVTNKETGDSGLGLSVAKSLAAEHDGELFLSNSKEKTFVLRFPLVQLGKSKRVA